MNFAVIENGIVTNTIVAESKVIAEEVIGLTCVEYADTDMPHIGLGYDGKVFEQPAPVEPTE
jgi:hypothetical protein